MNRIVSIYVRYKDQQGKRCFVPATYAAKARLKPQLGAVYYIRWYEGSKAKAKKVGTDPMDALKAQMRQEAVVAGERAAVEQSSPSSGVAVASAVEAFLAERSTQADERSVARWRWELELFAAVSGKTNLRDIDRADCFEYMKWYQQRKKAPRTVYNRMVSLRPCASLSLHLHLVVKDSHLQAVGYAQRATNKRGWRFRASPVNR
jgi:hypothetical protein